VETIFHQSLWWLVHGFAVLLCIAGIFISLLAISGTWLIAIAAGILLWFRPDDAPGWAVVTLFILLAVALEVFEFVAASLGIARRGGSAAAGWAALFGGLIGMVIGGFIPVPVVGSLFGMLAGSFIFAYWVEHRRLKHEAKAAHIARGAVWAKLSVMFFKTVAALGMTAYLWYAVLSF
jgi:uncharacterized protein YqgC (DUF456 family)